VTIKPNRNNWREFCEEPPLTDEERAAWADLANAVTYSDDLLTELIRATRDEAAALSDVGTTKDWADMVKKTQAYRRLRRAEIAWWERRNGYEN